MLAHSLLLCVLIGSVLQTSFCQGPQTDDQGTQTDDQVTQTNNTGTQTDDQGTQTGDTETQTDETETQTDDLGTQTGDTETQTDETETHTDDLGTQTDNTGTQTDEGEAPIGEEEPVFLPEGSLNPYRESITWDAQTAHPRLTLTADWKTATLTNNSQNLDNNTKRFDKDPCVLGSAGYQSGKHYWLIGGKGGWLVGVAAQSVKRKGYLYLDPTAGIYAIPRSVNDKPEKIGTFLECDKRQVSFLDAATREVLLSIGINCTEPIYPFAFLGVGALTVE